MVPRPRPVPLHDPRHLSEEVALSNFFHSCRPRNVVRKHVCKDGLRQRDGQAAEEKEAGG